MAKNPIDDVLAKQDAVTLDNALRKAPEALTEADYDGLIAALRRDRTRFITAEEKKAMAKEGLPTETDEETVDG